MSDEDVLVDGRPLSSLKVAELKEELESRNLSTKGVKAVLQDRLKEALVAQGEPVVDEQNPIVAGYLARQSAALEEARKRTESETSAVDTPTSDLSPVKKTEASPSKRTPRKSLRSSNAEPEPKSEEAAAEPVSETVSSESQELEKPKKDEAETEEKQEESASKNGSSELPKPEEKPAEEEKMDEETAGEVVVAPPQTAEEDVKAEEPKLVESTEDIPVEKEKVIEKPVEKQIAKEDDSDELDYGDDEEKEHKEESMDTDEPKQEIADEKTEEKKPEAGVEKEEKVRGSVSNRRASSPSSRHPVSSIVHIRGLTRPFTERMLRSEIEKHGGEIADFWIDKVKSHCFAKLATEDAADKVMKAMHDKVWPDGNPKKLAIVFDNEENFTRYKEGRGEVKKPEVVTIGTLTGSSRAERLSSTSQTSVTGKASLQITLQNVMRDNDKLDMERKEKRGSLAGRLTRIDDKEKSKEQPKEERKRGRSETPPFSRGAGFMDEKKAKKEEKEERSGKRDESHHREEHREARRSVVEEEPQLKTPDQLFKKTVAVPQLYYLPLTDEQVAAKAKKPAPAEPEKEKVPERSEKPSRAERDRGDRGDRGIRTEKAERGGDRDRDRERDHGRDRDRDHGRDHGRDRDRDRPRR